MDRKFDRADFESNPAKYELFRTAQIATHVFTNNGEHDLEQGQFVRIQFRCVAFNRLYRRNMPVYTIEGTGRDMYANTLMNFTL